MSVVTMKQLLEVGVHFGHQTHKWNPKMKKYIFIKRNGIHILDLKQTVDAINDAYQFLKEKAQRGEYVLFVGTKKQAKASIEAAAKKCGAFYVNNRWYGGMLTNRDTIRRSLTKLDDYERVVEDGSIANFTKLEATKMKRKYEKTLSFLGGIREMDRQPSVLVAVDTITESNAIKEAIKIGIPVVALTDTNSDPDPIAYPIPSNDDAIRAISLIFNIFANAVLEGKSIQKEGDVDTDFSEAEQDSVAAQEKTTETKVEKKPKEEVAKKPIASTDKKIKKEKVEIEKPAGKDVEKPVEKAAEKDVKKAKTKKVATKAKTTSKKTKTSSKKTKKEPKPSEKKEEVKSKDTA